jgi:hypothetical protein
MSVAKTNMGRDVNNKIKNGQNLWQSSLFTLPNDLHYISVQKALVGDAIK